MTSWASFAEADEPAEDDVPEAEAAEGPPADVEDMAVGKLRLWLRGVFGDQGRRGKPAG